MLWFVCAVVLTTTTGGFPQKVLSLASRGFQTRRENGQFYRRLHVLDMQRARRRQPNVVFASPSEVDALPKEFDNKLTGAVASENTSQISTRYLAVRALLPRKSTNSTAFVVDRLESNPLYNKLSIRDRSFCRMLVSTVERRLGQIDKVLALCEKERHQKATLADMHVQAVLRVGAAQILFMNVPPHAALKETIDVLRMNPKARVPESKIKFVNAVLRRLTREGKELLSEHTAITDIAAPWLVQTWKDTWGEAATDLILQSALEETPRCLTIKHQPRLDAGTTKAGQQHIDACIEYVASHFPVGTVERLPQGSLRIMEPPPGPIVSWPLYDLGYWWLQDVSATIPAQALWSALQKRGRVEAMHVVDLCAAPGGKTAQLANYGFATVTAVEVSDNRCDRLKANMERLNMNWNIVVADGTKWIPPSDSPISGVLADVPCTATGTASKRPDVLWTNAHYEDLLDLQFGLATHAADHILSVGGILIYSTCSLLKEESEEQVDKLLHRQDGARLATIPFIPGEVPGFDEAIDDNGWIRVLPGTLSGSLRQCDGFFVARLQRIT